MVASAACGEPVVGGSGRLVPGAKGAPDLLILSGSPYEMGWWHGKLLGDRIRALNKGWQKMVIGGAVGLAHDISKGAAGELRDTIKEYYVDIALDRMPEAARQELDGLSDATGISHMDLLFTEVLRDALRIHLRKHEPRLPGGIAAVTGPLEAQVVWTGRDATYLADILLVVQRQPTEGTASVCVAWPGALGGLAGLSAKRKAYLSVEAEVDPDMRGFGRGVPFTLAARTALEADGSLDRVRASMGGTAGHSVILLQDPRPEAGASEAAIGSVEAYRGVQPELSIDELGYVVIGPAQEVRAGLVRAGLAERPASDAGLRERVLAAAGELAAKAMPQIRKVLARARIVYNADRSITLEAWRLRSSEPCRVTLAPTGDFR